MMNLDKDTEKGSLGRPFEKRNVITTEGGTASAFHLHQLNDFSFSSFDE
jgi:hypothetical protein